ncbi:hypothetical protein [Clostridium sp. CF012]|nr:hypothetical protein [Clostridium sp. CF012]MBU3142381.1 hypothetical protein [Clostridium sp. CF012]
MGEVKSTSEGATKVTQFKLNFMVAMPPICHHYIKYDKIQLVKIKA